MPVISESQMRDMGFVCDWCHSIRPVNLCTVQKGDPGHSRICSNCLAEKGWKHTHCKKPGCDGWVQRQLAVLA